jgi:hypothetical protein
MNKYVCLLAQLAAALLSDVQDMVTKSFAAYLCAACISLNLYTKYSITYQKQSSSFTVSSRMSWKSITESQQDPEKVI